MDLWPSEAALFTFLMQGDGRLQPQVYIYNCICGRSFAITEIICFDNSWRTSQNPAILCVAGSGHKYYTDSGAVFCVGR